MKISESIVCLLFVYASSEGSGKSVHMYRLA